MYWVLFSFSFCFFLLGGGAMTTNATASTMMPTTTRGPLTCYDHICYRQDCLATDIANSSVTVTTCMTQPQGYCAIHVVSNMSYYEVTASCESSCQPTGDSESATATYCCTTDRCNDNETQIPDPTPDPDNGSKCLSLKWALIFLTEAIVLFLPLLSLG